MSDRRPDLLRRAIVEGAGTALLLTAVVGSGIMGERLAGGSEGLALLANSLATGAALVTIILIFGPISGAQINPAVTISRGGLSRESLAYVALQIAGALLGLAVAHLMFGEPVYSISAHVRAGPAQLLGKVVATFGLLCAVFACERQRSSSAAFVIVAYITGAYWFTSSTSFANPAVTIARALTDTFGGIRPVDTPGSITMQFLGAVSAVAFDRWLHGERS
jgi:glycerol uptake facilitator-like aquaporin